MPFRSHRRTGSTSRDAQQRTVTLASARLISRSQVKSVTGKKDWQAEGWSLYDQIPELRFVTRWLGNALSQCRLYIGEPDPDGGGDPEYVDNPGMAADVLEGLHQGAAGQGEMLRRLAEHLTVPGESFLVGMDSADDTDEHDGDQRWLVASTDEFTQSGGRKPSVTLPETGQKQELDPDTSTIIRIWNPHPKKAWEADSSVRANLPVLREILSLSQHIRASVDSRLAGAGVLAIPHSATMPNPSGADADSDGSDRLHDDPFINGLTQGMLTAIQDPDDASAVVPIVIKVPDEAIGKIQHLSFSTPLDEKAITMRDNALRRFARGSDLPPEILEGQGEASHWNAWIIDDSALQMFVKPLLGVICDALTSQYLWPSLKAAGVADPERYVIAGDVTALTQRPNRSTEAQALWDKGELSADTLRRENGFGDSDEPDEDERRRWLAWQLVQTQPALLPYLAPELGFSDMADMPVQPAPATPQIDSAPPDDTSRPEPPPEPAQAASAAHSPSKPADTTDMGDVMPAVEAGVLRALELAGNRVVSHSPRSVRSDPRIKQTRPWNLHTVAPKDIDPGYAEKLLAGAFTVLDEILPDLPCVRDTAVSYCQQVLCASAAHESDRLANAIAASGCFTEAGSRS